MKATKSHDGKIRFTVCIHLRADLADISNAIALEADRTIEPEFPKSRSHAMQMLREECRQLAIHHLAVFAEDVNSKTRKQARECAQKLFPEMTS